MTNKERVEKLNKAIELIREVEFSYPYLNEDGSKHEIRAMIYKVMVDNFSFTKIGALVSSLFDQIEEESRSDTV